MDWNSLYKGKQWHVKNLKHCILTLNTSKGNVRTYVENFHKYNFRRIHQNTTASGSPLAVQGLKEPIQSNT